MRTLRLSGPLLAAALVLVGCPGDEEVAAPTPTTTPTTLVVAIPSDLAGVNELLGSSQMDHEVRSQLFLHLVREQPDYQDHPPTFAPELAESWEFSPDRKTLTFTLRDDVLWSDGTPVTASDVRFSWQAQTSPDVGWSYAYVKEKIADVEAVDDHTVRFHFRETSPTQLIDANEGFVLPQHVWGELPFAEWRENADWFRENLVVDGPFTVGVWRPQQEVTLLPNPLYHREGFPRLEMVSFRVVPEEAARVGQLLAGEIHAMVGVPPARAAEVEADPDTRLVPVDSRQYTYIVWNTRRNPFADPAVRRALTMAIDRQALIESLWHGYATLGVGPFTSRVWAHDPSLEPWPYDPDQAREILAEQGWTDTDGDGILDRDGQPFAFELSTNTGNQLRRDTLVLIQSQLERVGVRAEPAFLEPQTLFARNEAHDFDATLGAWAIDTTLDVRYAFHSDEIDGGYNYGGFADPEADRLMDEIAATVPPEAALDRFHRLERILHEQQPYTFLWEPDNLVGLSSSVREADPNALLTFYDLEEWTLGEPAATP